jgi:riboflavin biosynthesis pyrimidine reductase
VQQIYPRAAGLSDEAPRHARTIVITTDAAPASRRAAAARTADVVVAGDASVDLRAAVAALPGTARPSPSALTLAHVVADDGYLLCRYVRP